MGCEARITCQRIERGEYLVSRDARFPQFIVREPVAVFGARPWQYGCGWTNYEFFGSSERCWGRNSADYVLVPGCIGLAVVPRRLLCPPGIDRWAAGEECPGMVHWPDLLAAWDALLPGRWIVSSYSEHGTDDDHCWYSPRLPDGVTTDLTVDWEIWT